MSDTVTIDITPVGLSSPEGVHRVNKAVTDMDTARQHLASVVMENFGDIMEALRSYQGNGNEDMRDIMEMLRRAQGNVIMQSERFSFMLGGWNPETRERYPDIVLER